MSHDDVPLADDWNYMYIDGERVPSSSDSWIDVENPATGEQVTRVPAGTERDVDRAFDAATAAQSQWADTPPQERAHVVQAALQELEETHERVTKLLVTESGSTRLKAEIEAGTLAPGIMAESVGFPTRIRGEAPPSAIPGKQNEVRREPAGVVGVITPWNFPFHLTMRIVAPAIALGNAVVIKPAEDTPITGGLLHAQLFEAAGLPPGVLNVVTGYGPEAGERVASHPDASVVSFTGSTEVGRHVSSLAGGQLALPALELGGNNPHIVTETADLDRAVDAGVFGSFIHQGQVCISINRHVVHESLYDEYVERLATRASQLPVGDPADPETVIGPLINEEQRETVVQYIEDTIDAGATLETGGGYDELVIEPTVLSGVTNDMPASCNEHFGPVAPVIEYDDDDAVIEIANDTEYGLAASVHSENTTQARRIVDGLEVGMVHVNDQPVNDEPHVAFGGTKASGLGRYNGEEIVHELTTAKWISSQTTPREYPF